MFAIGEILAGIVAKMGMMLLTETVIKKVAIITLRALENKAKSAGSKSLADSIEVIAQAWEVS